MDLPSPRGFMGNSKSKRMHKHLPASYTGIQKHYYVFRLTHNM